MKTSDFYFNDCIALCRERVKNGFSVLEYSVPQELSGDFRNRVYDEFYQYGALHGWTMKHYPDGKMAKVEEIGGIQHRTYFLKYTL